MSDDLSNAKPPIIGATSTSPITYVDVGPVDEQAIELRGIHQRGASD